MKIILGSTSEDKKRILTESLNNFISDFEITGVEADSGIVDQPLDEETTIKGAINRSLVGKKYPDCQISIGMEGGLCELPGKGLFLICVASIFSQGQIFLGLSSKLQLPTEVSGAVMRGESFGVVIREYAKKYSSDESLNPLVKELISREKSFKEAIYNAYLIFNNKKHYHTNS